MFTDDAKKRRELGKWIVGIVAICCLIYLMMRHIYNIPGAISDLLQLLTPLLSGLMLALVLNVPMHFLEKHLFQRSKRPRIHRIRRMLAIVLSLVCIIGIIIGIAVLVIPELVDAVAIIVQKLSGVIDQLAQLDAQTDYSTIPLGEYISQINVDWSNLKANLEQWFQKQSGNLLNGVVSFFTLAAGRVVDIVFSVIFALYILSSKEKLKAQAARLIRAWIPKGIGEYIIHAAEVYSKTFQKFIAGQTIEAIILGGLCALGMLILGLPYAPMIGALVGVMAMLPILGAYIAAFVGAFMILTVNPFQALVFLIFLVLLQQVEGNLIYPRVVGSQIKLPGLWILASVTIGGSIGGPIGILLGVPIASATYALIKEATAKRERKLQEAAV